MNVQLILFPQWDDGVPSSVGVSTNATGQFISNPYNFLAIGTASSVVGPVTQTAQLAVNAIYPTMVTNTWYGVFSFGAGALSGSLGALLFYAGYECVLQKVQGLTVSALYDVKITWANSITPQNVTVRIFNGTTFVSQVLAVPTANDDAIVQFTAPSILNTVVVIDYDNTSSPTLISSVSVKLATIQPPVAIQNIENGSVICDLYEDEDLPLSLSVDDFKNAAEQVQSYSKAFNLPATKRNNKIFDQMFEITRSDNGINFNPYMRTRAVLKENGFLLFEGYLKMLDITDKEGEISYNVNLYSEVVALADVLGDRTFADLNFNELKHDYTYSEIRNSWDGLLTVAALPISSFANNTGVAGATTTDVLKYPFVDWNHQFTVSVAGNPILPNLESAFRPWIKLKYCIDMIFGALFTPFSYTSSFFNSVEFGKLYMDFNWGADNAPQVFNAQAALTRLSNQSLTTSYTTLLFQDDSSLGNFPTPSEFGYSSGVFTAQENSQQYLIAFEMTFLNIGLGSEILDVEWVLNGVAVNAQYNITVNFSVGYSGSFMVGPLSAGDTLLCRAKSSGTGIDLKSGSQGGFPITTYTSLVTASTAVNEMTSATLLQTLRGELNQWEFLKGIITMFNLVTMPDPDNPNNLLIEPYSDLFITNTAGTNLASRGIQHDWTEKIDISEMKLEPLTDLNLTTIFKFAEDDDDFCFNEYKRQVGGHLYGSLTYSAAGFTILEGEDEIVAEPFAATVIKPLESQYADLIVPAIYARNEDGSCEGFDNAPRIMYNNGIRTAALGTFTSCTYDIPAQNGVAAQTAVDKYLQFSHLSAIPTVASSTADYLFGTQQLAGGLTPVTFNLFTRFWLPYYAQLYNPDTRTMSIKVNLNAGDIARFKFNDKVFIKNRIFRVNKIDYKPNDLSTVEFILIG